MDNRCNVVLKGLAPMGRAKRKQELRAVAARPVARATPLDDRSVEVVLDAVYTFDDGGGDPIIGLRHAVIGGTALWTIIGVIVFLFV